MHLFACMFAALFFWAPMAAYAVGAPAPASPAAGIQTADAVDTSTDFLSDEEWRRLPREQRRERRKRNMVARFEPTGTVSIERVQDYVQTYKDINVYDSRLYLYNVTAKPVEGTTGSLTLSGEVSLEQYRSGTEGQLKELGLHVARNSIAVLPDPALGDAIYALVTTNSATLRKEPRDNAEQVNSVALGGWLRLMRAARPEDNTSPQASIGASDGQWYMAQTMEGYLGFARADQFVRRQQRRLADGLLLTPGTLENGSTIPVGAYVYRDEKTGGYMLLHNAAKVSPDTKVAPINQPAFTAEEILELMAPLMQTKYTWGGVTQDGIDCSGFSQFLLKSRGIFLPRDSEEQAIAGEIVAFGKEAERLARPGDLLFFMNEQGRINHVGVSLGDGKLIHSQGRGVHVKGLRDGEGAGEPTLYNRLLFARRVLSR